MSNFIINHNHNNTTSNILCIYLRLSNLASIINLYNTSTYDIRVTHLNLPLHKRKLRKHKNKDGTAIPPPRRSLRLVDKQNQVPFDTNTIQIIVRYVLFPPRWRRNTRGNDPCLGDTTRQGWIVHSRRSLRVNIRQKLDEKSAIREILFDQNETTHHSIRKFTILTHPPPSVLQHEISQSHQSYPLRRGTRIDREL